MTAPAQLAPLSRIEFETLKLITEGRTYADIGRRRGTTGEAAKQAMHRVMRKLGAANTAEAILLACRAGLLDGRPFLRHGDHAGYEAHRKRRIPYCDACIEGEKAYRADLKARQEAQKAA